jgi:hypothetical protein
MSRHVSYETVVGAARRAVSTFGLTFIGWFCVVAVAAAETRPARPPLSRPPPALISIWGDTPELRVTAVDNVPIAQIPERALLRDPNAIAAKYSVVGVWVTPGAHLLHSQFTRNMSDGINLSQGNVRVVTAAGHTYLISPQLRTLRGKAAFEIIDLGTRFPQVCLPGVIDNFKRAASGQRFSGEDIGACRRGRVPQRRMPPP